MKKKTSKFFILFMSIIIVISLGLISFKFFFPKASSNTKEIYTQVILRDFSSSVLATGIVKPQIGAEVRVGTLISGKVKRLFANIGDQVEKGQVLATLEDDDLQAIVDQHHASVQIAQAQISSIKTIRPDELQKAEIEIIQKKATCDLTEKELNRQVALLKQDFTTQQDKDRAEEKLSVAKANYSVSVKNGGLIKKRYFEDLKLCEAQLAHAQALLKNAQIKLAYASITAPIKGVIASVSTQEGETVSAGLNAPTFVTIIDLNRLQVDAYVDEVDIGKVKVNQKVFFSVDAFPAQEFTGKVKAIYPKAVIQDNVVNYVLVIEIIDPYEGKLRPEMTSSVTIHLDGKKDVLAIPAKALQIEKGKHMVYIPKNDRIEPQEVTIGSQDEQWVEICKGLKENQKVVLELSYFNKPK